MPSGNKLVIYTPTYHRSTGLQYRLSMLIKTLKENGYKAHLYIDEHETLVRGLYARFAKHLLKYEYIWKFIGKHIANKVLKYNPDIVFLTIDTTAGAIPLLKSKGVKTVLLLEDLTVDWLQITGKNRERILKHLSEYASQTDIVVVPSKDFRDKVRKELGIDSIICPPGLELRITLEEALSRPLNKICILHARQIVYPMEAQLLELIPRYLPEDRYVLYALKAGKYHASIKSEKIHWYRYSTLEEAVKHLKKYHIGLIATPRNAPTFTSYWFHLSLLQPLVTVTNKQLGYTHWLSLKEFLKRPLIIKNAIIDIVNKYEHLVKDLYRHIVSEMNRKNAHAELLRKLKDLS